MKKIILHACCAPCASYPIEKLRLDNYEPVVFFYNPNIFPYKEYKIRRDEIEQYCLKKGVEFYCDDYEIKKFYSAIKGFENEPERGKRCSICLKLRLEKAAQFTLSKNIADFTTTLTISPHKDSNTIFEVARNVANDYGIHFLEYNFKKQDGFKISRQIAKENAMYFQQYCGCAFSMRQ